MRTSTPSSAEVDAGEVMSANSFAIRLDSDEDEEAIVFGGAAVDGGGVAVARGDGCGVRGVDRL